MNSSDIEINRELQQILWACYDFWQRSNRSSDEREICYTWIIARYRERFGTTFHQAGLHNLVTLGYLTDVGTARRGKRQYYRLINPDLVDQDLRKWGIQDVSAPLEGNPTVTPVSDSIPSFTFRTAFESDSELQQYKPNALALFALDLYLCLDDVDEFAVNAIVEGPNDKKVDIVSLNISDRRAIICQSYYAQQWGKDAAPANKASDLNTAVAWLLSANENQIPEVLRSRALDIRRAVIRSEIDHIDVLYVHNCHECINVDNELKVVAVTTKNLLQTLKEESDSSIIVSAKEIGLETIEDLYRARDAEILIDGWISIPEMDYIKQQGEGWTAILTSVPGYWIQQLYQEHADRLFSANYRDYLGSTKRQGNINHDITQTAEDEPVNFWVYNNGITALTNEIRESPNLQIRGISIINGAQTSGAISEASQKATQALQVPIRFVECKSRELINKIIQYNNTQNAIRPFDRRSNDPIQRRLREELGKAGIVYVHRRSDIRVARNAITAPAIAPALAAFHGHPQIAYRSAPEIFLNDDTYNEIFPKTITAEHVFLIRALSLALDSVKAELKSKSDQEKITKQEAEQLQMLRFSASKHFLFYLVGSLAEEIMASRVSDLFEWKCAPNTLSPDNHSLMDSWKKALQALLPHIAANVQQCGQDDKNPFFEVPRSNELSKEVLVKLKPLMASLESVLKSEFEPIRKRSTV